MKGKHASQTTIIGGESGATAVFIAGHGDDFKMPLKDRIQKKKRLLMQKKKRLLMQKKNTIFFR